MTVCCIDFVNIRISAVEKYQQKIGLKTAYLQSNNIWQSQKRGGESKEELNFKLKHTQTYAKSNSSLHIYDTS